jgi:hypothetical protein
VLPERLLAAAEAAKAQDYVSGREYRSLRKELEGKDAE